jgi:hypothetical protein
MGRKYNENFPHRNRFIVRGEDRMIQKAPPSELMAGNIKRTETAERTNPARPILRKAISFWRKSILMGLLDKGSTLKLYR